MPRPFVILTLVAVCNFGWLPVASAEAFHTDNCRVSNGQWICSATFHEETCASKGVKAVCITGLSNYEIDGRLYDIDFQYGSFFEVYGSRYAKMPWWWQYGTGPAAPDVGRTLALDIGYWGANHYANDVNYAFADADLSVIRNMIHIGQYLSLEDNQCGGPCVGTERAYNTGPFYDGDEDSPYEPYLWVVAKPVPLPGTLSLFGLGLAGLCTVRRNRKCA